jgi:eukaryotic-like serine/threonine-protein kinase
VFHVGLRMCLASKGKPAEAYEELQQAVDLDPKLRVAQYELRSTLLMLGRLEEVHVVGQRYLASDPPEHLDWYGYAELCLYLGRKDEYRRARQDLLARFGERTDPQIAERTARACLLLPTSGDELRRIVVLAQHALAADRARYYSSYPHFLFVAGLAEFRQGRLDQAISLMRGEASGVLGPAPRLVLAMALHQRGQVAEAKKMLEEAVLAYDWKLSKVRDQDDWIYHILRREAETMIGAGRA